MHSTPTLRPTKDSNSYVISEQGKPPDFVMEIASESTGQEDTGNKRTWYADLGIPEYWRFDQTGRFHGSRLAGDRLVDGRYEPIAIEEIEPGILQGYSAALGLFVRWQRGELRWHDPETGQEIPTFEQERKGRLAEREGRWPRSLAEQEARRPRPGSGSWRRNWRGDKKRDKQQGDQLPAQFSNST